MFFPVSLCYCIIRISQFYFRYMNYQIYDVQAHKFNDVSRLSLHHECQMQRGGWFTLLIRSYPRIIGTLRSHNGDVHENVTEKWTPHPFKPFHHFPKSPCYLKEGNLGWNWREGAAPEFRQRRQNLSPCRSRPQKTWNWSFHVVVVQGRQRNVQKSIAVAVAVVRWTG